MDFENLCSRLRGSACAPPRQATQAAPMAPLTGVTHTRLRRSAPRRNRRSKWFGIPNFIRFNRMAPTEREVSRAMSASGRRPSNFSYRNLVVRLASKQPLLLFAPGTPLACKRSARNARHSRDSILVWHHHGYCLVAVAAINAEIRVEGENPAVTVQLAQAHKRRVGERHGDIAIFAHE
jgi:hypothetical protein